MQVKEREAGRTPATNTASAIPLRVVAGMPFALGRDPLRDLEFVDELEHGLSFPEKTREPMYGPPLRVSRGLAVGLADVSQ